MLLGVDLLSQIVQASGIVVVHLGRLVCCVLCRYAGVAVAAAYWSLHCRLYVWLKVLPDSMQRCTLGV